MKNNLVKIRIKVSLKNHKPKWMISDKHINLIMEIECPIIFLHLHIKINIFNKTHMDNKEVIIPNRKPH